MTTTYSCTAQPTSHPQTSQQRNSSAANEEYDLYPLFYTILGNVTPPIDGQPRMKPIAIAETISSLSQDTLIPFHSIPFAQIQAKSNKFLSDVEKKGNLGGSMSQVLGHLYDISLLNSSMQPVLNQIAQNLPLLQERVDTNLKNNMNALLSRAEQLLSESKNCNSYDQVKAYLSSANTLHQALNDYRTLKQYIDPNENQRLLDLAKVYQRQELTQYSQFLLEYPKLVQRLKSVEHELKAISEAFMKINALKLQLQKFQAQFLNKAQEAVDPLQIRFINAFSTPFYQAFAWHFWTMTWNSLHDRSVAEVVQNVPGWRNANYQEVDPAVLNRLWTKCFPDFTIEDWMLKTLKLIDPAQLNELEVKLQALEKNRNETNESLLDKDSKAQIQAGIFQNMKNLCLDATEPAYSTLAEIKNFLYS